MAKPKIPNQKKKYQELNSRLNRYVTLVEQIYDTLNLEAAKAVSCTDYSADSDKPFRWSDYPQTNKQIADIQSQFINDIHTVIYRGTSDEWKNSNEVQDLMADKVLKAYTTTVDKQKYKVLYQTNSDALEAFQNRKDKGFNISAKLWQQSAIYKEELEAAISCAIQKGTSAVTLSKQISKYLLDFPSLQKDYKDKYGNAEHLKDCEYRSIRLARSEINIAYRTAENERWQQMDFVVGYEIKLSGKHPAHDVCDLLAGKYPKGFVWTGWHPNDLCYKIPILKTDEEFWAWDGRSEATTGSVNEVKDVPDGFNKWVDDNQQRIDAAKKRGTLPYFLKDNPNFIKEKIVKHSMFDTDNDAKHSFSEVMKLFDYKQLIGRGSIENDGCTVQGYIGELQGYNGLPKVVDANSFNTALNESGCIPIYRGYRRNAQKYVNEFKYGKLFEGEGAYGNGSYFATSESVALSYTNDQNKKDVIYGAFNKNKVKIANYEELESDWLSDRKKFGKNSEYSWNKQSEIMNMGKGNDARLNFVNSLDVYEDFGSWCTAKGYDFIYIKKEDFYVMLNRTKLIIKE